MKCHNKSEIYERMMDLTVEIDGDVRTLEQALRRFTASEMLEGDNKYYCNRFAYFFFCYAVIFIDDLLIHLYCCSTLLFLFYMPICICFYVNCVLFC